MLQTHRSMISATKWMGRSPLLKWLTLTLLPCGLLVADSAPLAPQPQVTFTKATGITWNASWDGVANRTYFAQGSTDLVNWTFLPILKFGMGSKSSDVLTAGSPRYFFRLVYLDDPGVTSEQEARDADFDQDGIPNAYEVEHLGSNPLDKTSAGGDADHDGLPDGWELFYFGSLNIADPNAKLTPNDLTNQEKSQLGLGPSGDDITSATQRITYNYDGERLNQVNYYSQRSFTYSIDPNGNVEATSSN